MTITPFGVAIVEGDNHLSKWIVEHGRLDVQDMYCRLFQKYIPEGGVVCDVGACLGDHTLSYSKMVGPKGKVYAYEPNPAAFQCLAHNFSIVRNRLCNVRLSPVALGKKHGWGKIINPPAEENYNLGGTKIGESDNGSIWIDTLDEHAKYWERLDFIKIDVEGSEPDVIAGALATLKRLKPVLLIELNRPVLATRGKTTQDVIEPLESLGYRIQPSEEHLSYALDNLDVLCLPT